MAEKFELLSGNVAGDLARDRAYVAATYNTGHEYQQMLLDLKSETINGDCLNDIKSGANSVFNTMVQSGVLKQIPTESSLALEEEVKSLRDSIQTNIDLFNKEKNEKESKERQIVALNTQVNNFKINITTVQKHLFDMTTQYNTGKTLLDTKEKQLLGCKGELAGLKIKLAEAEHKVTRSGELTSETSKEIFKLQAQIKAVELQAAQKTNSVATLDAELKFAQKIAQDHADQLSKMQQHAAESFKELSKLQNKQKDFDNERKKLEDTITLKNAKLTKNIAELVAKNRELDDARDTRQVAEIAMRKNEARASDLEKQIIRLETATALLDDVGRKHDEHVATLNAKLEALQKELLNMEVHYENEQLVKGCVRGMAAVAEFQESLEAVCSDIMCHIMYHTPIDKHVHKCIDDALGELSTVDFATFMKALIPNTALSVELGKMKRMGTSLHDLEYCQSMIQGTPVDHLPLTTNLAKILHSTQWKTATFRTAVYKSALHRMNLIRHNSPGSDLSIRTMPGTKIAGDIIATLLQTMPVDRIKSSLMGFFTGGACSENVRHSLELLSVIENGPRVSSRTVRRT